MRKLNTPLPMKKATLLFPSNPCLTVEVLSSPPLSKIYLEVQLPSSAEMGGGAGVHTMRRGTPLIFPSRENPAK